MTASRPTLLMTRPEVASERFVASLDPKLTERVRVVTAPLIRVVHRDIALDLSGFAGVIFTSANGVHAASTATDRRDLPAFCVGPATTRAAAHAGWEARQVGQDAESLITGLLAARPDGPLLHIRGAHARGDVAEVLTKQGLTCGETVL